MQIKVQLTPPITMSENDELVITQDYHANGDVNTKVTLNKEGLPNEAYITKRNN